MLSSPKYRLAMSETQRFLLLSIFIGIFAGLLVVCFHITIDFVTWFALGGPAPGSRLLTLTAPALGALAAGALVRRFFPAARGSGVNHTKAAIYVSDGYVPFSTVAGKFLACSVSIGTGNPMGPEDPALQMGSGVASYLGRLFRLPRESLRQIAPVGAAAGIAAAFNTPITGVLFVMEEVVASWNAGVLGSIVLSAVSAVVVERWFLGDEPLFGVPAFELTHPSELAVYAVIGVLGGVLSALFVRSLKAFRQKLERLPNGSRYWQPGVAGLIVGVVGLWLPGVLGAGYETIDSALHERFPWTLLLVLGVAKLLLTLLSFSAGTPGGMFAPTLFTGAMIGGGIGMLANAYWPFPSSPASAYMLAGMGTFFAGLFRAPMTSIFMVFEVSASYVIILPVMIANTISYLISRALQPESFFRLIASQEGLDLPSVEEQREGAGLRVEDAMRPPAFLLDPAITPARALDQVNGQPHEVWLVPQDGDGWSYVSRQDLEAAVRAGRGQEPLQDVIALPRTVRLYPDLSLDSALRLLGTHPLLPVSSRANPRRLLGTVSLDDVHRAYGILRQG